MTRAQVFLIIGIVCGGSIRTRGGLAAAATCNLWNAVDGAFVVVLPWPFRRRRRDARCLFLSALLVWPTSVWWCVVCLFV